MSADPTSDLTMLEDFADGKRMTGLGAGRQVISRATITDAAARVITRRGEHRMRWAAIAYEAGNAQAVLASRWFVSLHELIDECYSRSAQGLGESLLCAETAPGTALDKVAAFIVTALEIRRARGVFLSFRRGADLPPALQRRLHEHDTTVRTRLKRLLNKGRRDGSLALRNLDSAVELLLATLQVPTVVTDGPEQRMWDSELVELLLAALSEPHPPQVQPAAATGTVAGSCLCGQVRYELDGPLEVMSHCRCSLCRSQRDHSHAPLLSLPLTAFRWVAGETSLSSFRSAAHGTRTFCSACGSSMPVVDLDAGVVLCPSGYLDGDSQLHQETQFRRSLPIG